MVVFEVIHGGAQFASQGMEKWLQVLTDLPRHPQLDVFRFLIANTQRFSQATGQTVAPDGDNSVQLDLAAIENRNRRVFESQFNQGDDLLGERIGLSQFKGVYWSREARNDVVSDQSRRFATGLNI